MTSSRITGRIISRLSRLTIGVAAGMLGPPNSGKIDHRRRGCAIFMLICFVSTFCLLAFTLPMTNKTLLILRSYFTMSSKSYKWSSLPMGRSNSKLGMQSYPIFPEEKLATPYPNLNNATRKVILLWTALFGRETWALGSFGREPFLNLNCPVSNCVITNDRSRLNEADAVLIHFRDDFDYNDRPKPGQRKPNQIWVFVLWESPVHTYGTDGVWQASRHSKRVLQNFSNFFNWTMTYRLDSDVHFNYGRHIPLPEPDFSQIGFDRLANKTKTAAWMTSHCDTVLSREALVKDLLKHGLDIDIIGECGSNVPEISRGICKRPESDLIGSLDECLTYISSTYKFYFAFENSLCRDYVTEKFYRAAGMDLIPVVLNGADMSLFAPPHSYIDAHEFSSPDELVAYLKKVGSDSALFNSYFWWKPFYDVEHFWDKMAFAKHFCDLCAKLNSPMAMQSKSYADIDGWWTTDGLCYE